MLYALALQELVGSLLLEEGMSLQLVDGRFHFVVEEQVLQPLAGETCHADGTDAPFLVQPLQGTPGGVVVAVRFVQQVEVHIVESQQLYGFVKRP